MAESWSPAQPTSADPRVLRTHRDVVGAAVRICDETDHPEPTGDLRADLVDGLVDFADDLAGGHLDRVLASSGRLDPA